MAGSDKQKQSLYFPEETLAEIMKEAIRLDRSLSWTVQQAWRVARDEVKKFPSVGWRSDADRPTPAPVARERHVAPPVQRPPSRIVRSSPPPSCASSSGGSSIASRRASAGALLPRRPRPARRLPGGGATAPGSGRAPHRTCRYMRSSSSSYIWSARSPPSRIALVAQCFRWLRISSRPTARRASWTEAICVRTSAQ